MVTGYVRQVQGEFREFGEPILDWFHVAMRTTQLTQSIKGLAADPPIEGDSPNRTADLHRELRHAKAYLCMAVRIEPCARSRI